MPNVIATQTAIPAEFGHAGAGLQSDGGSSATDLKSLLTEHKVAIGALDAQGGLELKLAVDFTKADAAVLYTVPVGLKFRVARAFWENTIAWTGGSSSAIGLSSSNAGYNTKGDLQGGSGGDLTAAMGTGYKGGSAIGAKLVAPGVVVLVAGDTIRFDRIASVYTAGAGFAHVKLEPVS